VQSHSAVHSHLGSRPARSGKAISDLPAPSPFSLGSSSAGLESFYSVYITRSSTIYYARIRLKHVHRTFWLLPLQTLDSVLCESASPSLPLGSTKDGLESAIAVEEEETSSQLFKPAEKQNQH
jgi:hypothetical protein